MRKPDVQNIINKLNEMGAKKILLQLPDGLKPQAYDLFNALSRQFSVVISSGGFYGACDVGTYEMYSDVDCIVQLGHSIMPNVRYPKPIIFEEFFFENDLDLERISLDILSGYHNIGLLFSIQYMHLAAKVGDFLTGKGFHPIIGKQDERMAYPGQVIGCNFSSAHSISGEVDCYLVVSTGKFHAIGVQLSADKETFILDVNEMQIVSMKDETDRFLRKRYAKISRAVDAKNICVVADTKIGQYRIKLAELLMKQATSLGLNPILLKADDVKPSDYENLRCDAVVFTGCPRVSIDDEDKFSMPILTPPEFQSLFKIKSPGRYVMDEITAVDNMP